MKSILQGTTPSITFHFANSGLSVSDIDEAELTITSKGEAITHTLNEMAVAGNDLTYHFTEDETLRLNDVTNAYYQLYVKIGGEIYGTIKALCNVHTDIKGRAMDNGN